MAGPEHVDWEGEGRPAQLETGQRVRLDRWPPGGAHAPGGLEPQTPCQAGRGSCAVWGEALRSLWTGGPRGVGATPPGLTVGTDRLPFSPQVSRRFRELMRLFHTACEASSEEEEDAASTGNTDQLSDRGDLLSEEELDA